MLFTYHANRLIFIVSCGNKSQSYHDEFVLVVLSEVYVNFTDQPYVVNEDEVVVTVSIILTEVQENTQSGIWVFLTTSDGSALGEWQHDPVIQWNP